MVVLAFVICWLPFHIGRIIFINTRDMRTMLFSQYFNIFALQLFYLSASINPVLYNLVSKKYRAAACKLLLPRRAAQRAFTVTKDAGGYTETSTRNEYTTSFWDCTPALLLASLPEERSFRLMGESQKDGYLLGHVVFHNCLCFGIPIFLITKQAGTMK